MTSLSTTKQGTLTVSAKQLDITGKTTIHSGDSDRSGPVFIPDNITVLIMVMVNRVIYVGQGKQKLQNFHSYRTTSPNPPLVVSESQEALHVFIKCL